MRLRALSVAASAVHAWLRSRRARGTTALVAAFAMLAGLLVTVASPAEAGVAPGSTSRTPPPAAADPAAGSDTVEPLLRDEPLVVVAGTRHQARKRLAALLAAQRKQLVAAQKARTQAIAQQRARLTQNQALQASKTMSPQERAVALNAQRQQLQQANVLAARRRALAAQAEANRRLREALEALAKALSTSSCKTVGGTNGQQASISCPLDDARHRRHRPDLGQRHRDGHRDWHRHRHRHRHRHWHPGDDRRRRP